MPVDPTSLHNECWATTTNTYEAGSVPQQAEHLYVRAGAYRPFLPNPAHHVSSPLTNRSQVPIHLTKMTSDSGSSGSSEIDSCTVSGYDANDHLSPPLKRVSCFSCSRHGIGLCPEDTQLLRKCKYGHSHQSPSPRLVSDHVSPNPSQIRLNQRSRWFNRRPLVIIWLCMVNPFDPEIVLGRCSNSFNSF